MPVHYRISFQNPATQYIDIQLTLDNIAAEEIFIRMSAWRPGRYELGNFVRNIRTWKAFDDKGNELAAEKTERERWKVTTGGSSTVVIRYDIFGGVLNAGSTYLDPYQLYMNPVNSFCYMEGREHEECTLDFVLPEDYIIAAGMEQTAPHTLKADNFDHLADSPLIASNSMKHLTFTAAGLPVHLWFQGECKPDMERIKKDFSRFIEEQINAFGGFPEKEYHFLFQITPHRTHHGVEHGNSTVCMLGPTYALMTSSYDEFLELSSHEFYHSWNIKKIRPVEMQPYDYTGENYFRTGYVAEGVTTYYGDIMLYRAGVLNQSQYFSTVKDALQKHFHNYARYTMPVSEASFDAWVDGYEPGAPHRKTSIYTEGALLAMIADIRIIQNSQGKYSLDDVMKELYVEFALKGKGYTQDDYRMLLEKYSGVSFGEYFEKYVRGTEDFTSALQEALGQVGLELKITPSCELYERNYGFKVSEDSNKILNIAPGSPAYNAGLMIGEVVASVNGFGVTSQIKAWFAYFREDDIQLRVRTTDNRIRHILLPKSENNYFPDHSLAIRPDATEEQRKSYRRWTRNDLSGPAKS